VRRRRDGTRHRLDTIREPGAFVGRRADVARDRNPTRSAALGDGSDGTVSLADRSDTDSTGMDAASHLSDHGA
jgi:hypothetical protein